MRALRARGGSDAQLRFAFWWLPPEPPLRFVRLPVIRAECEDEGLCLKFSCKHNTTLDVTEAGSIRLVDGENGNGAPPVWPRDPSPTRYPGWGAGSETEFLERLVTWLEGRETNCVLDHASKGGMSCEDVAAELGVSSQRVSAEERTALAKLRAHPEGPKLLELLLAQSEIGK